MLTAGFWNAFQQMPPGGLWNLGKRRLPGDELAEKIVAEAIAAHLELCTWRRLERPTKPSVTAAR